MSITYGIIRETYESDGQTRRAYGIAAYANAETEGTSCVLYAARDLCGEREPLDELVRRLNREEASALHFGELINDFLAER